MLLCRNFKTHTTMKSTPTFTPVFKIYKEGMTVTDITIVMSSDMPFDIEKKKQFYISLGYTIINL